MLPGTGSLGFLQSQMWQTDRQGLISWPKLVFSSWKGAMWSNLNLYLMVPGLRLQSGARRKSRTLDTVSHSFVAKRAQVPPFSYLSVVVCFCVLFVRCVLVGCVRMNHFLHFLLYRLTRSESERHDPKVAPRSTVKTSLCMCNLILNPNPLLHMLTFEIKKFPGT